MSRRRRAYRDVSLGPIDEQEQEEVIHDFELEAMEQRDFFRTAFAALVLLPTPLYVILPYCRYNGGLSLLSLLASALAAYSVYYLPMEASAFSPMRKHLPALNVAQAAVVAAGGYIKHRPWRGYDYLWTLPLLSALTAIVVRRWLAQTEKDIAELRKAKYPLKGA